MIKHEDGFCWKLELVNIRPIPTVDIPQMFLFILSLIVLIVIFVS